MTRRILINGRRAEELRVAIVDNQTLEDFEIETKRSGLLRNNIYRGVVANIAPSLNAAFVDFGDTKNGFLAFNDVVESVYCKNMPNASRISDILTIGQTLIVQVIKDATGLKGAQVTTNISLAGRYLVLRPKDAKSGVSRKVDEDARADLTQKVRSLDLPEGYGCIVRTNAMDQSRAILLRDAKVLVQLWHKIEAECARGKGPALLYNDQDIVVQAMRDYFDSTINEVLIDDKSCYERALAYVRATFAGGDEKLRLYDNKMPLFTRFGIEKQIDQIYAREVQLPSGGFIVIDPTEALTAIDVNSAHSTKRETQDLTAYHTNLEAAVEIGRQLRMRDIGGLIVIDFIDMRSGKHQRDVERVMRNAMARDKARNKVERISANGLLEINRQRISQTLAQRTHLVCPTCGGRGFIPSADAIGLNLIREIDARAVNGELGGVIIKLHPDIAEQVQNVRRRDFAQLENEYDIRIEIVASRDMSRGEESIEWLTKRQESELHPEALVSIAATDAASIIDVAEAYQAQETEADSYRPNDFEEYSSEDARRRRAAKRANRRELAAQADSEVAEAPKSVEAPKSDAKKPEAKSKSGDAQTAPAHCYASSFITLAALVELLHRVLIDFDKKSIEEKRPRRRFSFKSRHHFKKQEDSGIRSDLRLFATDIIKAVSAIHANDASDESLDLANRIEMTKEWLTARARDPESDCENNAKSLLEQISSRHAFARVSALFNIGEHAQPDALTQLLIAQRDAVYGDGKVMAEGTSSASRRRAAQALNSGRLADLYRNLSEQLRQIFGSDAVIASFDEDASASSDEAFAAEPEIPEIREPEIETPAEDASDADSNAADNNGIMLAEDEDVSRRRHRRARRRQAIEDPVSPFLGDNEPVITSNVPIAPMTFMHDEDTQLPSDENLRKVRENQIAQEITQELPAVAMRKSSRRVRRTRSDNAVSAESDESFNVAHSVENVAHSIDNEIAQLFAAPLEVIPTVDDADKQEAAAGSRRVRRTRRERISDFEDSSDNTEPAKAPAPDFNQSNSERAFSRQQAQNAQSAAKSESKPQPEAGKSADARPSRDTGAKQGERRVRRTRRKDSQDVAAPESPAVSPIAEAIENTQPVASTPQLEDIPAPVEVALSSSEENRSTRRVRRVRAAKSMLNESAPIEQEQPVAPEPIPELQKAPVIIEPAETDDDSAISNRRSHRTRRRTRRFSMSEPREDAEYRDDSQDFSQDFEPQQEPAPQPEIREIPESEPASDRSERRPRIRRTHRSRLEDN